MQNAQTINSARSQCGFSLMELMVSITVAGVLAATAAPNFSSLIARNKVTTHSNAVIESLNLARSYAISRQKIINICHRASPTATTCSNDFDFRSKWSFGWLVFIDHNNNRDYDANDELIRTVEFSGSVNIVFNQQGALRFHPDGSARSSGFYLCDKQQISYKHVYLLHTGRARINDILSAEQQTTCDEI